MVDIVGFGRAHVNGKNMQQRIVFCAAKKIVLFPNGDGNMAHIDGNMDAPEISPILLEEGVFELGRGEDAELQLPLPTVSSRHAMVKVDENGVTVTDLGSTNGTFVDGVEIEPMTAVRMRYICIRNRLDDPSGVSSVVLTTEMLAYVYAGSSQGWRRSRLWR